MNHSSHARQLRHGLVALACAAALLAGATSASAAETATRSAAEVRARWRQLQPAFSGSPYDVRPVLSAPYAAGSLKSGFLQDGLNSINYARYLAGLPDDVVLDPDYTSMAQHGAVLLAVGEFAHSQSRPKSMNPKFYETANGATSSSNIGWGYGTLWGFNFGCLNDEDTGNIDRLGHRRWLLNPAMKKTGMGMAPSRTDTWVFDRSRESAPAYDSVKWPSAGPFPIEMFGAEVPWSITLNPKLYSWTSGRVGYKVTLRRQRDGKLWTFTSADINKSHEYFNFETSGFGVANCFVFRPDPEEVGSYRTGEVFDVTLTGGIRNRLDGSPATISYRTQFMSHRVASTLTLGAPKAPAKVRKSRYFTVTGYQKLDSREHDSVVRVYKYRKVAGGWKKSGYVRAKASKYGTYTKYTVKMKLTRKGRWRLRAFVPADSMHGQKWSTGYEYVSVR